MEPRLILINLLVKLGVATSAASILGRSVEFKSLLFREERSVKHRIYLVLWIGIPKATGMWIRFTQPSFLAGDLSFQTAVLLGVIAPDGSVSLSSPCHFQPGKPETVGAAAHLCYFHYGHRHRA